MRTENEELEGRCLGLDALSQQQAEQLASSAAALQRAQVRMAYALGIDREEAKHAADKWRYAWAGVDILFAVTSSRSP